MIPSIGRPRGTHARAIGVALLFATGLATGEPVRGPSTDGLARVEARSEFERGIQLAERGQTDAAITAFEKAYDLSPHYSVLYNIGQAHLVLGRPVQALSAFERYLTEGGRQVPPQRRDVLEHQVEVLKNTRIGFIEFEVTPASAEVIIDGASLGKGPGVTPIPISSGTHGVVVKASNFVTHVASVKVVARERQRLRVALQPLTESVPRPSLLMIACEVPGVDVYIDGILSGPTPLVTSVALAAGSHRVRFSRAGFRDTEREVSIERNRASTVWCDLVPSTSGPTASGQLSVHARPRDAAVIVDGRPGIPARLALGPHRVRVTRSGYQSFEQVLTIHRAERRTLKVTLRRTPESRAEFEAAARRNKHWAFALGGAALALLGSGIVLYAWNGHRFDAWHTERSRVGDELAAGNTSEGVLQRNAALHGRLQRIQRVDDLAIGLGVAGAFTGGMATWFSLLPSTEH